MDAKPHLRILVTGSRDWTNRDAVREALIAAAATHRITSWADATVVHGGAQGADRIADEQARDLGARVEAHPADWRRHGNAAGHIRNGELVRRGADICLAFPLGESSGTRGCMKLARKAGVLVRNLGDPDPAQQPGLFEETV